MLVALLISSLVMAWLRLASVSRVQFLFRKRYTKPQAWVERLARVRDFDISHKFIVAVA